MEVDYTMYTTYIGEGMKKIPELETIKWRATNWEVVHFETVSTFFSQYPGGFKCGLPVILILDNSLTLFPSVFSNLGVRKEELKDSYPELFQGEWVVENSGQRIAEFVRRSRRKIPVIICAEPDVPISSCLVEDPNVHVYLKESGVENLTSLVLRLQKKALLEFQRKGFTSFQKGQLVGTSR